MKAVLLLALVVFAFGCSKDSNSDAVTSSGACTQATINAYNRLAGKSVSTYSTRSDLQSIKNDCSSYKVLIGNSSCKAEKLSTGEAMTISSYSVDSVCDQANVMMSRLDNQNQQTGTASDSTTNYGACSQGLISAYNDISTSTLILSDYSTLDYLEAANRSCDVFSVLIGSKTCKAEKAGLTTWIDQSSHLTVCARVKKLKQAALKQAEIDKIKIYEAKEKITFDIIKNPSSVIGNDGVLVYQVGRVFIADTKNSIDEKQPYCLVSAKFSIFLTGIGRIVVKNVFIPHSEDLLALSTKSENFNEENTINCLNAKGKQAKDLTVADLKTAFKGFTTIELIK